MNQNNAAQAAPQKAVLTDLEIQETLGAIFVASHPYGRRDVLGQWEWEKAAARAIESAVLSKLRATVAVEDGPPTAPDDDAIAECWVNASDCDGIAYDGPSFERGYRAALASAPVAGEAVAEVNKLFKCEISFTPRGIKSKLPHGTKLYAAHQARPSDDDLWDQTLQERDHYHDMADRLANAIGAYFGQDVGEHSSSHCPWHEALGIIDDAAPQASEAVRNDGFSDGVITALEVMTAHGDWGGTAYCELLQAAGLEAVVRRAIDQETWESAGLDRTPMAAECRAALSAQPGAQKEQSDA